MALSGPGNGGADEGSQIFSEINITPLTDVFLVLLIIFMVSSSVMSNLGVNVDLPKASPATAEQQPEGVIVTLMPKGEVKINNDQFSGGDTAGIEGKIKTLFQKTASRMVILEGDRQALLGSAIGVMDSARKAGAEKFAIATSPEK